MPGKFDPKTKECLCKCFCDTPNNEIASVQVRSIKCNLTVWWNDNIFGKHISEVENVHVYLNIQLNHVSLSVDKWRQMQMQQVPGRFSREMGCQGKVPVHMRRW